MSRTPKCRAKGGPANCTNPNCPEKKANQVDWSAKLQQAVNRAIMENLHRNTHRELSPESRRLQAIPLRKVPHFNVADDQEINADIEAMFSAIDRESAAAAGTRAHQEVEAYYASLTNPDVSGSMTDAQFKKAMDDVAASEKLNATTVRLTSSDGQTTATIKTGAGDAPIERATARSLKVGDVIAFDDHGALTDKQVLVKTETRGDNTRLTWRSAADKNAPVVSEWIHARTPISVFKRKK